jgi:hypothetical protein
MVLHAVLRFSLVDGSRKTTTVGEEQDRGLALLRVRSGAEGGWRRV